MKLLLFVLAGVLLAALPAASQAQAAGDADLPALMKVPYANTDGTSETLAHYKGKAIVLVNTASKCGYTPQYAGLEELYRKYEEKGLVVVAFPSNDFGGQEPGTDAQILEFCRSTYDVTFPVKSKMPVKGDGKSPLYAALTGADAAFPGEIGWNFEKFVIDRSGRIVARFKSKIKPDSPEMLEAVAKALGE